MVPDATVPLPDDAVPRLRTQRLVLRGWRDADREPFAALNEDREVMRYFPATLSRAESDALVDRIVARWATDGFGLWAVERAADRAFLGFTGLATHQWAPPGEVEVGWRFARGAWGRGYATEAARAAVRFAFETLGLDELVSYTTVANWPSRRVMERLGMRRDDPGRAADFDHPALPVGHPLRPHVVYRLPRADGIGAEAVADS